MRASTLSLRSCLDDPRRPAGALSYHALQGFLFTIAAAPELVPPSEWLPIVLEEGGLETLDRGEMQALVEALLAEYNAVTAAVAQGQVALPPDCAFRPDALANLEPTAPVARWARGFVLGHTWLEECWNEYVPDDLDEDIGAMLLTLSFFASRDLAEAFLQETGGSDLQAMAATIQEAFPLALCEYADLGLGIQNIVLAHETRRREAPRVGRNDPCPCGSGRKYKRCCGNA